MQARFTSICSKKNVVAGGSPRITNGAIVLQVVNHVHNQPANAGIAPNARTCHARAADTTRATSLASCRSGATSKNLGNFLNLVTTRMFSAIVCANPLASSPLFGCMSDGCAFFVLFASLVVFGQY